ncbi:restriction endonuclease subunit S [Treponema zioleckii]|uniref:restriction endonuclease subunit S n=1 Tax=Treponema zioleckii TaxID=331680 RepID=UPI00168B5D91|nr:restriction endonuclease subunit S [Treponema zioleckii]
MNIFQINRSDIEDRFDPPYYKDKPDFSKFIKLSKIAVVKGGKRIPLGMSYTTEQTNYLYLRVADMLDGDIDYSTLNHIGNDVFEILKSYEISKNDIALSIAGTIGKVIFLKNIPQNNKIILTENCAKIQIKDTSVLSQYLALLLILNITQKQIELNYIQTTIPKLGLDRIRNLYLPPIPPLSVQQTIVDLYTNAQNQRKRKLEESQKLLESVDDYLFAELGIELPLEDNKLKNRIFISSFHNLTGGRIDPFANTPVLEKLRSSLNNSSFIYLKDAVTETKFITTEISSSDTYIGLENIESNTGNYIKTDEKETISSALLFERGQILFPKLRPYLNKVYLAEFNGLCSTEFHVFNAKNMDSNFLHYCLLSRITLEQTSNLMTGNTLPRLQSSDIAHILIPYPPFEKQREIAKHIQEIRNHAKQLKNEADMILQEAKQKVERMILGDEQ